MSRALSDEVPYRALPIWEAFGRERGLAFTSSASVIADPLLLEGEVGGVPVRVVARRKARGGYETIVRATAPLPTLGRVVVRPTTFADRALRVFRAPLRTGDASLDAELTVEATPPARAEAIRHAAALAALRVLAPRGLVSLACEAGVIAIRCRGATTDRAVLDAAVTEAARLAGDGVRAPYR